MKKFFALVCVVLIASTLAVISFAHPGNTDGNGGHYNRSTGEYHYHHGYSEHQHPNGVCPYDYDDNTNHKTNTPQHSVGDIILTFVFSLLTALVPSFALLLFGIPLPKSISERITDKGYRVLFVFLYFVFTTLIFVWLL